MLSFKPLYDMDTGTPARFSKSFSAKEAIELAKEYNGKITLFEDYYKGWYILPLKKALKEDTALLTTLVLLSFCDALEQFRRGKASNGNTTSVFTKNALKQVYKLSLHHSRRPSLADKMVNVIYDVLRNGLHHDMTTRGIEIIVSKTIVATFQEKEGKIVFLVFNVLHFLECIEKDFSLYTTTLYERLDETIAKNFERTFSKMFPEINN